MKSELEEILDRLLSKIKVSERQTYTVLYINIGHCEYGFYADEKNQDQNAPFFQELARLWRYRNAKNEYEESEKPCFRTQAELESYVFGDDK